jgi:hypothetical protein
MLSPGFLKLCQQLLIAAMFAPEISLRGPRGGPGIVSL